MSTFKKIIVVHPGTQHAYRLANALSVVTDSKIKLYSWFILSEYHYLARFKIFRKRTKKISKSVVINNFPLFEIALKVHIKIFSFLKIKNNNPYYFWQMLFAIFLLPLIYFKRKSTVIVLFETCGWPLAKYAKKWGMCVVMDFASISHEIALELGVGESKFGIKIKSLERQFIDFGLNCSKFALSSYVNKTSAKKLFPIWLGTDFKISNSDQQKIIHQDELNICCLANTEKRKGLDILLDAFNRLNLKSKKLYLIGRVNPDWIAEYCNEKNIDAKDVILTGPIPQKDLTKLLIDKKIHLHVLPSRFDSFGMVVPETMAIGIPNIVSPYVGAGEMIEDGIDGFIMKTLSSDELLKYIFQYLSLSEQEKINLIQATLAKSSEMTWENYDKRIKSAFDEIFTISSTNQSI